MRKTTIENKYNLTPSSIQSLHVNREKVNEAYFWRNDVVRAWCISDTTAKDELDYEFGAYSSFWFGVFDEDSPKYAGQIQLRFYAYGDMCSYVFNNFLDFAEIENTLDLQIQEKFLTTINYLIDEGVFILPN